ncbi:MAG: hypothetical protein AMJ69_12445, partial [Gammaproteobacteria bacterium SG8_47]
LVVLDNVFEILASEFNCSHLLAPLRMDGLEATFGDDRVELGWAPTRVRIWAVGQARFADMNARDNPANERSERETKCWQSIAAHYTDAD